MEPLDPNDAQQRLDERRAATAFIWCSRASVVCLAAGVTLTFLAVLAEAAVAGLVGVPAFGVAAWSTWSLRRDAERKLVAWGADVPSEKEWLPVASAAIGAVASALIGLFVRFLTSS